MLGSEHAKIGGGFFPKNWGAKITAYFMKVFNSTKLCQMSKKGYAYEFLPSFGKRLL